MSERSERFLGCGVRFPIHPDRAGALTYVDDGEVVRQSIEMILDTEPGERVMLPTFGCGLRRYLMEPNTVSTRSAIESDVTAALTTWEPRIQLTNVTVAAGDDPALVHISIEYVHVLDSHPANLVYPFYLR